MSTTSYTLSHHPTKAFAVAGRGASACLLLAIALVNVISVMLIKPGRQMTAMEGIVTLDSYGLGRAGALLMGALFVMVAFALLRGKRHAWLLTILLIVSSLASAVLTGAHLVYAASALVLLIVFIALAPFFRTRSDPRAIRRGYFALGAAFFSFTLDHLVYSLWQTRNAQSILLRSEGLYALRLLVFLFLGFGVVEALRPVVSARYAVRDATETARVRRVIDRYGRLGPAYFALGADKCYFWSASGQSVIAYRLAHRVALALGDPIGPPYERDQITREFVAYCSQQDWLVGMYQASEGIVNVCRALGLRRHKIGEEAVVDVARFTTQGKVGAPVRHSIARAKRDGVTVQCWQGEPLPEAIFTGLKRISQAWLSEHNTQMQMGFSMGTFPSDWSEELLTVVALDANGEALAFLTWTPLLEGKSWSLDIMRRLKDTVPGTMEYLIAESITWARERGAVRMSLGLAPLAGLDAGTYLIESHSPADEQLASIRRASWLERSASFLHRRKFLLGNYASLYAFKAKFQPSWEGRYLVVSDTSALPRVFAALLTVHGLSWGGMLQDTLRQRVSFKKSRAFRAHK